MTKSSKIIHTNVTFRNTEPSEALRSYAVEKIEHCLQKFVHHDTEAQVVLTVEKHVQHAEVRFNVDGASIQANGEGDKLYAAVDKLIDSLTQQLRKHKEKMTDHHRV